MLKLDKFFINGEWVSKPGRDVLPVIDPSTEKAFAEVTLGSADDVDEAVKAASAAFPAFSNTSREERLGYLQNIIGAYKERYSDLAAAVSKEMGAPIKLATEAQAGAALGHFQTTAGILQNYQFEEEKDGYTLVKEPIGVAGLITPWNWPLNQIACKVAPAIAAGCTMVLKPSEIAPYSAYILAEVIDAAGLPKGVFNMLNGTGPEVGAAISSHPRVDIVSFTGSTRAGVEVAKNAAETVKRVSQELGGKSANIILEGADLEKAVAHGVISVMTNSGQSCNAPTRMLVPADKLEEAEAIAKATAESIAVGPAADEATRMGPVSSEMQWNKVQSFIEKGVAEGAALIAGGAGRPDNLEAGYFVKPTVFSKVNNQMTIAREEIFGPVLSILPYESLDEAVAIANDTPYGLSGYVYGADKESAVAVAKRLRTGNVHINGARANFMAPFGGYKQSGNGREWGELGLVEFLETKAVIAT